MQVIEFMDTIRRPVSVVELARYLDYPQSSVSGLVQTLLVLGYLHFDPVDRTYTLSSKVSFMGLWVRPDIFRDGALWKLLKDIRTATGETAVLATRRGAYSHYIYVEPSGLSIPLTMSVGAHVPVTACSTGFAMLSQHSADELWKIVAPLYPPEGRIGNSVAYPRVAALACEARRNGFSYIEAAQFGTAALAAPLCVSNREMDLSVGVAAPIASMRQHRDSIQKIVVKAAETYRRLDA